MATTDKRKFELNKGSDHSFDISKGSKRKFDLTKDDDAVVSTATSPSKTEKTIETASQPMSQHVTEESNGSKKWIIWAVVIVVLALLAWWIFSGNNNPSNEQVDTETTEVPKGMPVDSVATAEENVEDATAEDVDATSAEAEPSNAPQTAEPINNSDQNQASSASVANTPSTAQPNSSVTVSDNVDVEAMKVIRGEYGNNPDRRNALGARYHEIQTRVNQLMSK